MSLTGTVVGNGAVYQGVALTNVPLQFLLEDCVNCANLLRVNTIASGVQIQHSVSYVKNSQFWFIIEFNYADTGLTPVFQYTVQLNPQYANFFRIQDLMQPKLFQTIDPVNIPDVGGAPKTSNTVSGEVPQRPGNLQSVRDGSEDPPIIVANLPPREEVID